MPGRNSLRCKGRVPAKDLADAADAAIDQVSEDGLQERAGRGRVAIDAQMGVHKGADQPAPDRALVVSAIPPAHAAAVAASIVGVSGGQAEIAHQAIISSGLMVGAQRIQVPQRRA
jgi:hypothetical protein